MNSCTDLWQILMKIDIQPFHLVPRKLYYYVWVSRSRWLCGLRRRSEGAWLLGSWVRIPLRAWMFVSCVCRVDRGLCDDLITRDPETSTMRRPRPELRGCTTEKKKKCLTDSISLKVLYCVTPYAGVPHEAISWHIYSCTYSQHTDIIVYKTPI